LEVQLEVPAGATKAILLAHSFRNSFHEPALFQAVPPFSRAGYATLALNFLGHGDSGGELKEVSYRTVSENVSYALQYLRGNGFQRVGVYAISLGTVATVLSSERPNAQVFLSSTPLYDPQSLLKRYQQHIDSEKLEKDGFAVLVSGSGRGSFKMGREWIEEMRREDGQILRAHLERRVPTLIIQGTNDELTDINTARAFIAKTGDDYLEIPEANHNFTMQKQRDEMIKAALNWFNSKL